MMANRLREFLPDLVDEQQKGFVKGRSITDNILAFKAGQEWCEKSNQQVLIVKLDFEKAYDRVGHEYLWQTMAAMEIDEKFIKLTQGLVEGATSKLHVAGTFSKEIVLERGVRQGCPLAPLLFSIATQPLMLILREKEREGKLTGLHIKGQKTMLHSLFADDSGVMVKAEAENFNELQEAVRIYKRISGAKLNLRKSTIIPLGLSEIPDWLQRTGCHIARKGEIIRYLGFPIGWGITEEEQKDFVMGKMKKKLNNWKFRRLSFSGRVVALKHVVRCVPIHLLACLNLQKQTFDDMESICRTYLWGISKTGTSKVPLIAWAEVQRGKHAGGLGLADFRTTSKALRLKQIAKMFTHPDEDWIGAAEQLIRSTNSRGRDARERRDWLLQEVLLLNHPIKIPKAPTLTGLLEAWKLARGKLILDDQYVVSKCWQTSKILKLAISQKWITQEEYQSSTNVLRREGIQTAEEWKRWSEVNTGEAENRTKALGRSLCRPGDEEIKIQDMDWKWRPKTKEYTGWNQPTGIWKALLSMQANSSARLNSKWSRQESDRKWGKRLKKLWHSPLPNKERMWIWKTLQHCLPTLDRISKWGHGNGKCKRCNRTKEDMDHLLTDCMESQKQWAEWQRSTEDTNLAWKQPGDFISKLDEAWSHRSWAKEALLHKVCWNLWLHRNASTYGDTKSPTPIRVAAVQAIFMLEALKPMSGDHEKAELKIRMSIDELKITFNLSTENTETLADMAGDQEETTRRHENSENGQ
ncbi:hypothetical protein R1sor_021930 [Riccia sorocarpa]|uniref:Reverse transcriptase domain-containing protein n=1 Tax=Riccia sorocarpa TaxID=122646 RepID=A0ABD3GKL2_9MARC